MKRLRFARSGYIVISFIFYAAAAIYFLFPELPPLALCCFSGILLIVYGIIKIIGFFSEDLYCLAFRYDLAFGLLILVIGVLTLVKNVSITQYLPCGLGWITLLDSLFHIQMSKEACDFGLEQWKLFLGFSIAAGALSVLLIIRGVHSPQAARILVSVILLLTGVINHCTVIWTVRPPAPSALDDARGSRQRPLL